MTKAQELDDLDLEELESAAGSTLRKKLEETISKNRELSTRVAKYEAAEWLSENGFQDVKPEDLVGVDPEKYEEKAKEVRESRTKEREQVLRDVLQGKGLSGDELEREVQSLLNPANPQQDAWQGARQVSGTPGVPSGFTASGQLTGPQMIEQALRKGKS